MNWWIDRQNKDKFVKLRQKEQKISRAYYKIKEINEKFNIIKKNNFIFDLGGAPGGWSQYFKELTDNIFAIDIINNFLVKGVNFIHGDIYDEKYLNDLPEFDIIASDMAPNLSGNKFVDSVTSVRLCERALEICKLKLKKNGFFITKIFNDSEFDKYFKKAKSMFKICNTFKPQSSRSESKEIYIIGLYFKKSNL